MSALCRLNARRDCDGCMYCFDRGRVEQEIPCDEYDNDFEDDFVNACFEMEKGILRKCVEMEGLEAKNVC